MSALTGPINSRRKKSDLEAIAQALNIDSSGTMKILIPRITAHLTKHPELAENVKFQGLFSYRPEATPAQKNLKRSSDKAAEDEIEAKGVVGKPTGANKTLLDLSVTTDPPPQFGRLGITGAEVRAGLFAPDEDDISGEDSSPDVVPNFNDGIHDQVTVTSQKGVTVGIGLDAALRRLKDTDISGRKTPNTVIPLVVNFFDHMDPTKPAEEVWLEDGFMATSSEGAMTASLSRLLPGIIQNTSPIKERGGRLYRPGRASESGRIDIGAVNIFASGETTRQLSMTLVDEYVLRPLSSGEYACDIFWEQATPAVTSAQAGPSEIAKAKPLEVARDMKETKTRIKNGVIASPAVDDDFIAYLREYLDLVDITWPRADLVSGVLDRHLKVEAIFQSLKEKGWVKGSRGGFRVPADHPRYATQSFVRNDVHTAMQLASSKVHGDTKLFSADYLINAPKAAAWVSDPQGEHQAVFSRMTPAKFKRYVEEQNKEALDMKRDSKMTDKKKRKKQYSDDTGEEGGAHKSKKGKGKAKAKPQIDSDDLDESDE